MGTLKQNYEQWMNYNWPKNGDEWSHAWGGTEYLWYGTIMPRIHAFIPAVRVLEIAPGFGRITHFLKDFCQEMIVVDFVERCIEACKKRFHSSSHIQYFVNDGKSLPMTANRSIDFIFSWDSLVHAEQDVMQAYIKEFKRVLKPDGYGFIHHSNMGYYSGDKEKADNYHWRAESMSADLFATFCRDSGLRCVSQEIIGWGGKTLNDCFSVFTGGDSASHQPVKRIENANFMDEAERLLSLSAFYSHD